MLANGLAVQIDIHPEGPYKQQVRNGNEGVERFVMLWRRLAAHYANRDPEKVFFEIMNEPEVNDPYRWAGIQAAAAPPSARPLPKTPSSPPGPTGQTSPTCSPSTLSPDGNVIYTFHFYEPHEFTHQGASWGTALVDLHPWHPLPRHRRLPRTSSSRCRNSPTASPSSATGSTTGTLTASACRSTKPPTGPKPTTCRCFATSSAPTGSVTESASRMNWIRDVRTALEADDIGWTMWDYRGGFGVVWKDDGQPAKVDGQVVEALGLKQR